MNCIEIKRINFHNEKNIAFKNINFTFYQMHLVSWKNITIANKINNISFHPEEKRRTLTKMANAWDTSLPHNYRSTIPRGTSIGIVP